MAACPLAEWANESPTARQQRLPGDIVTAQSNRIDQIEAAILGVNQNIATLAEAIASMNQPQAAPKPPAPKPSAPKPKDAPQPQTQTPTTTEKVKCPKATAGRITGTVYQHAVRRFGYAVIVDSKEQGKVWINTIQANNGQPLFADLVIGQAVAYVVKESGHIVIDQLPAPKAAAAPKAPPAPKAAAAAPKAPPAPKAAATAPTMKLVEFGPVGDACPQCSGKHSNENKIAREMQCLGRIYLQETGKTAGGIWDVPFISWAHDKRGAAAAAPIAAPEATVPVAAPVVETVTAAPEVTYVPKIEDGEHTVTLVEFPRTGTGRVKVHNLETFNGHDDRGRWIDLYPALYAKVTTFTANDRLVVTFKQGVVTRVKRIAKIEADTGVVAGVETSGLTKPSIKITGTPDDTRREMLKARRKALRKAS